MSMAPHHRLTFTPRTVVRRIHPQPDSRVKHALCDALARALADDPFVRFVYGNPRQREKVLSGFLANFVNNCVSDGHIDVLLRETGEVIGGALWMGPGNTMIAPTTFIWRMVTGGTLGAALKLGMKRLNQMTRYGEEVELIHRLTPLPHYYLSVLGIVPEFQGRGLGAMLLAPTIEQARRESLSLYAESTNPNNLAFYERQGFQRFHDGNPASGPSFFALQMFP
jgi:ribosomal protein S18 acetylase RimI-like enzyme